MKWRTANVFTVKQLTMCPGWLLRKTILEGFRWSGNFALQESRSRRALHQGWKWAFKIEQFSIDKFDFVIVVHSGKAFSLSKTWRAKLKILTLNLKITFLITYPVVFSKLIGNQMWSIIPMHFLLSNKH